MQYIKKKFLDLIQSHSYKIYAYEIKHCYLVIKLIMEQFIMIALHI